MNQHFNHRSYKSQVRMDFLVRGRKINSFLRRRSLFLFSVPKCIIEPFSSLLKVEIETCKIFAQKILVLLFRSLEVLERGFFLLEL